MGVGAFVVLWVFPALGIVGYHLWNAASPSAVPTTRYGFEASGTDAPRSDQAERLRELEKFRADGLVTDEEYKQKRAEIMGEDW